MSFVWEIMDKWRKATKWSFILLNWNNGGRDSLTEGLDILQRSLAVSEGLGIIFLHYFTLAHKS